jgi:TetR/AcrR family transcriptional regulator, transcriptional repressor of bet genes
MSTTTEQFRRQALIDAAIVEIGTHGGLDVTVGQIARRAGVSSALAHHYFGSKERILLATMRHLLVEFAEAARWRLALATTPRARLSAIVAASFSPEQFQSATITAWLAFYGEARRSDQAMRLLSVYTRRLRSNIVFAMTGLMGQGQRRRAIGQADIIAALIDGLYLRYALRQASPDPKRAIAMVEAAIDAQLGAASRDEASAGGRA